MRRMRMEDMWNMHHQSIEDESSCSYMPLERHFYAVAGMRIADSLERIADSLERLERLERARHERW